MGRRGRSGTSIGEVPGVGKTRMKEQASACGVELEHGRLPGFSSRNWWSNSLTSPFGALVTVCCGLLGDEKRLRYNGDLTRKRRHDVTQ